MVVRMKAWEVFLNGRHVDTVFFDDDCDKEYVLQSLIEHDGYNPQIRIVSE
jgi:hypothetical protein